MGKKVVELSDIGKLIREKRTREGLSLVAASQESGVSPATLSRIERRTDSFSTNQSLPDVRTLDALTSWLGVSISGAGFSATLISPNAHLEPFSTPDVVEAHLRADRNLDAKKAELLAQVFRAAYENFAAGEDSSSVQGSGAQEAPLKKKGKVRNG
jgi:transcriptional regulator with XRE-family HTH domain